MYNEYMTKLGKKLAAVMMAAMILVTGTKPVKADGYPAVNGTAETLASDFVYVLDFDNGQVLADKKGTEKMYPASMTKLMTVILAMEHWDDWNEYVKITQVMVDDLGDATVVGFWADDLPTVRDLIYSSMMLSAADSTNAIAVGVSGSIPAFVELMNTKAKEIGMKNTHFTNTSGMHDENHYSTCEDIAVLLKYCAENEDFRNAASQTSYHMTPCTVYPDGLDLDSSAWYYANQYSIPGFRGGKAGYTGKAGHCLAAWCRFNGMNIGIVTAHADTDYYAATHFEDTAVIAKKLYAEYERKDMDVSTGDFGTLRVHRLLTNEEIPIREEGIFPVDAPKEAELTFKRVSFPEGVMPSSKERTITGTIGAFEKDTLVYTMEVSVRVPAQTNKAVNILTAIGGLPTVLFALLGLILGVLKLVNRPADREE